MTFLNPLVLLGLAAAAIPVLIHLLNLRRLRTVEFSSLRFLKELQRSSIRRVRIRQWILLALRTLLVVALVLAFSRPAMRGSMAGLAGGRAATTMVVLLDDSPSMSARNDRGLLFQQARDAALRLASLVNEGDQFYLLPLSEIRHRDQFVAHRSREAAAQALQALSPSQERLPFPEAMRAASRVLAASTNPNQEVYLLTDAQATQFGKDSLAADSAARFDPRTRVFLVRTAPGNQQNSGVSSALVTTRILTRSRPAEVQALIRNEGPSAAGGRLASVYLDGARVVQQAVDIPAGGTSTFSGRFVPRRSGILAGSVQIEDDALEADNRRFFTVAIPERINVLLVGAGQTDTRFVHLGLTLQGDSTLAGLFAVRQAGEAELPSLDLASVDVVILCNVRGFAAGGGEQLSRFVRSGGGLMIFPGAQTSIPNYNETLFPKLGIPPAGAVTGTPLEGAPGTEAGAPGAGRSSLSFQKIDREHPLFSGLFEERAGRRAGQIASPRVFAALTPGIGQQGHAVVTLSNGAGFLVEYPSGEGRVLLFAVEAGASWSDFPLQGLFAPLLYRSVLYLAARGQSPVSFTVGEPVECQVRLKDRSTGGPFVLVSPSGVQEKVVPEYRGTSGLAAFRLPRSAEAGVFELHRAASTQGGASGQAETRRGPPLAAAAVNIDPAESNLRPADDPRIQRFWNTMELPASSTGILAADQQLDASVEQSRYGVELWKHFLALALLLAVAEMIVGRASPGRNAAPP